MKLMIVSDIHGSAYYCKKMLEKYEIEKPDKLIILGDVLYHGPRNYLPQGYNPKEVIGMLNPLRNKIIAVRGNCDAEVDQMVLDFPIMADYSMISIDDMDIYITHGHIFNKDNPISGCNSTVLYGHTHIPANEEKLGVRYLNPGSISLPKNDSRYSYMIYENRNFKWIDLLTGQAYLDYQC